MNKKLVLVLIVSVLAHCRSFAQYYDEDAAVWLKAELEKKMTDKISLQLTTQCRINNNVSQIGQVAADIGIRYKLNKHFSLMGDYVLRENRRLDGTYLTVHQFYTGIIFKQKFNRFTFRYRLRLQTRIRSYETATDVILPSAVIRNKFTLKYELDKRFDVFTAYELSSPLLVSDGLYFSRSRTYLGTVYNINKKSAIEAYFMLQNYYTYKNQPRMDFVYGLNYVHNF